MLINVNGQICSVSSKDVTLYSWTPSDGTIADYSAGIIDSSKATGFIIILGSIEDGVFTVEGGAEDDSRGGTYVNLAFSSFEGNRATYNLYNGDYEEKYINSDSLKYKVKQRVRDQLLKYVNENIVNPGSLKSTNYLKNANEDNSLWSLRIRSKEKNKMLSWKLEASPRMCWCFFDWKCSSLEIKNE